MDDISCNADEILLIGRIIRRANNYRATPQLCFGSEARAVYTLERKLGSGYQGPSLRRFYLRPPTEPALLSIWSDFVLSEITERRLVNLVGCLLGRPATVRQSTTGIAERPDQRFPAPSQSGHWIAEITRSNPQHSPLRRATAVFAQTLVTHPFADGNGRLARAMFTLSLAKDIGLPCPFLPLGPACYVMGGDILKALSDWTRTGDLTPLHNEMIATLSLACDLDESIAFGAAEEPMSVNTSESLATGD